MKKINPRFVGNSLLEFVFSDYQTEESAHHKAVDTVTAGALIPPPEQGSAVPLKRIKSKRFVRKKKRRKPDC